MTFRLCGGLANRKLIGLEVRVIPEMGDIPVMDRLVTILPVRWRDAEGRGWISWAGLPGRPLPVRVPPSCLQPII